MLLVAALIAGSCSSNGGDDSNIGENPAATSQPTATSTTTATPTTTQPETPEEVSVVVPFTAANGSGTVMISGDDSPVVAWFANQPGEVSLDLVDADVNDDVSVVE